MKSLGLSLLLLVCFCRTRAFSPRSSSACCSPLFRNLPPPVVSTDLRRDKQQQSLQDGEVMVVTSANLREQSELLDQELELQDYHKPTVDKDSLQEMGYPQGLCNALEKGAQIYCKRYWIIDDSLSMKTKDGHVLLYTRRQKGNEEELLLEKANCTRWMELQDTCSEHALLAAHLGVPTDFRLLNRPTGHFRVPRGDVDTSNWLKDVKRGHKILRQAKPTGMTPLQKRLEVLNAELRSSILPRLACRQKVAVVLATDGLPTLDDQGLSTPEAKSGFKKALMALAPHQVSVVIRLCTDDEDVVRFYRDLEAEMENVNVLDDYWAEADRIASYNPWLTCGVSLHRVRESNGCAHETLLQQLSQRKLSQDEVAEFCSFLFGWNATSIDSWEDLCQAVEQTTELPVWNPMTCKLEPWVDLTKY